IPLEAIHVIRDDLEEIQARVRNGTVANCGKTIGSLASSKIRRDRRSLADTLAAIEADLRAFKDENALDRVVVVNLASTEPPILLERAHTTPGGLARLIKEDRRDALRASTLYSWAALRQGMPFLNFTPSNACILPAHVALAKKKGIPIMGNDGKTGETLVKSALAPMFKYRNFRVLTWQGYNILGDRDGQVLADPKNKTSKISSKDGVLSHILGYPLNTHVSIEYAPSLSDLKTAWDFIHFQGFLDYKMSLQFTWQGCDAILAAPIVLDMVRLADFALQKGESGLMTQLACFFKSPMGVDEHDLHFQFHHLMDYLGQHGAK
ncbi:MAG: inositol-3-phosphate synthase, partial [Planctomycetes bacterium]|nr:inositol-3-phosphate synthase [Planctomycetota bacterium]